MKSIKLNAEQIIKLLENKYVNIENKTIEIQRNEFVLNNDGFISYSNCAIIKFDQEHKIDNKHIILYLQKLICQYFNLCCTQVIFTKKNYNEYEFNIKLNPNNECRIVVCEKIQALNNTQAMTDEQVDITSDSQFIGLYKKLNDSFYYFRWLEDI